MNYRQIGSILWILNIQYFIVQIIVAAAYSGRFSLAHNTISDLGNTVCGNYADRFVCSPLHDVMNGSFIVLGITQLLGALLLYKALPRSSGSMIGFGAMMLAGFGTIIVGLFPENTIGLLHAAGAALPFIVGNIAMLVLGARLGLSKPMKYYSYASGMTGIIALVLFMTHMYLGIGQGGMERLVAYPQTIWMIIVGVYLLGASRRV